MKSKEEIESWLLNYWNGEIPEYTLERDVVLILQSYASQSAGQGSEGVKWRLVKDGNIPDDQYLICGNDDDIFVDTMYQYYPQAGFVGYGQLSANHNITRYVPISSLEPLPVSPSKPTSEGYSREDMMGAFEAGKASKEKELGVDSEYELPIYNNALSYILSTPPQLREGELEDGWVKIEDGLPVQYNDNGDTKNCLVYEDGLGEMTTATAWYNHKTENWTLAHHSTHSLPITVTHWQPLPKAPKK